MDDRTELTAKFRCTSVEDFGAQQRARLSAVSDDSTPENLRFAEATPSGTLELTIDNPSAHGYFRPGESYYLRFEKVPAAVPTATGGIDMFNADAASIEAAAAVAPAVEPIGEARSMGVHESQSLFFEMQLARSLEFTHQLAPMAARILGRENDPAFSVDNIYRFNTRMKRGYIRVNADEITYPAHVILRYEIERALIEGDIEVTDIPELWDQKMQSYLGLSTQDNYRDGCMQDIHWTGGAFGYFPSYTLGAIYAAQLFDAAENSINGLRDKIQRGELTELFAWLKANIWQRASTMPTDELIRTATGESLNATYFQRHLSARYL